MSANKMAVGQSVVVDEENCGSVTVHEAQQCSSDADCPEGMVCVDGTCQEPAGEPSQLNRRLLLAGIGAGALGIAAVARSQPDQ